MTGLIVLAVVVGFFWWRRRAKRALVAGLDKPALYREAPAGRINSRRTEGL